MFVVTEDWYFVLHRLELAVAARAAGYDVVVATRAGQQCERITAAGLRVRPVDFDRAGLNPIRDLGTLLSIARIYRQEAPDLVHHMAIKPIIFGSIAARLVGVRSIVNTLAGLGYVFSGSDARSRLLRRVIKPALKFALSGPQTALIVENRDDRRRVIAEKLSTPDRVHLIRGAGVNPDAFRPQRADSETPLVILPARLLREKGIAEFVAAARSIRARGVKARFALVGAPDPANPSSVAPAEIDAWVAEGVVEYWGWQEDMPAVFSQAQIVCLPTFYGEGLPRSLLEAAAAGCAIVTTDNPGCKELVEPGVTGWMVPMRQVTALTVALHEAIERPDLRAQFAAAARALIATDFSMARVTAETLDIYRRVTGARPGSGLPHS
jgi:glycosyltransferase involved in cell wall biosynthesis